MQTTCKLIVLLSFFVTINSTAQNCLPKIAHDSLQLVTNRFIRSAETKGDTVFIGGNFNYVGKYTGGVAPVDSTGKLIMPGNWPRVHGFVYTMIKDDAGGYYIGGRFNKVGDSVRSNLVHIDSFGHVTSFKIDIVHDTSNPKTAAVYTLCRRDDKLYIGGQFSYIDNRTRTNAACLDLKNGKLTAWHPYLNGRVRNILLYGKSVYLSGGFTAHGYNKTNIKYIVAVDTLRGDMVNWSPIANKEVLDMYIQGNEIYVCGRFSFIGGSFRNMVASFSLTTGNILNWYPVVTLTSFTSVNTICVLNDKVYFGGDFNEVNGKKRDHLAAVDKNTGILASWNPLYSGTVTRIRVHKNKLYVGGTGGVPNNRFTLRLGYALYDTLGNLDQWISNSPYNGISYTSGQFNEGAFNFLFDEGRIFLMGETNSIGGVIRRGFAAFNAKTAEVFPIDLDIANNGNHWINALKRNGNRMYIGGNFDFIGGKFIKYLAAYDIAGDSTLPWAVGNFSYSLASPEVNTIEVFGSKVYVGGLFSGVQNQTRYGLCAVDSTTGALDGWVYNNTYANIHAITRNGNNFFVGGSFSSLGGQSSQSNAAVSILGNVLPWNINSLSVSGAVDIDIIGKSAYLCCSQGVRKVDTTTSTSFPTVYTWKGVPNIEARSLLYYNSKIHVGGAGFMSGNLDTSASVVLSTMNLGLTNLYGRTVYDIHNIDSTLYAFGDFRYINGGEKLLSGIIRFELTSKVDTGIAKIVAPMSICGSSNQHQLWNIKTNMQSPIFTWYRNGTIVSGDSFSVNTVLDVKNGDTIYCKVKSGTGCYLQQNINSDTVIVNAAPSISNGILIGPDVVCSAVPSKYLMKTQIPADNYWWTYKNQPIANDSNEYWFTPSAPGFVACWVAMPDSGCYENDIHADSIDITTISPQIVSTHVLTPTGLSNKCVGDSTVFRMKTNFTWRSHQWTINGMNVGFDNDSLLIPSLAMNDTVKCTVVAESPNCFTKPIIEDSVVTNVQPNTNPTINISGPTSASLSSNVNIAASLSNATNNYKIKWSKNGTILSTTTVPSVGYSKGPGIDTIVAEITTDGCNKTAVSNTLIITDGVSVQDDMETQEKISVYPNPFHNKINVTGLVKSDKLDVYDIVSRSVINTIHITDTSLDYNIDLEVIAPGLYFLKITSADGLTKSITKIQKQ